MVLWSEKALIELRRALHQIPEIGLEEHQTQAFLLSAINRLPQAKLTIKKWRTGIVVKVSGSAPDKTIGWRTDIDGLPMTEETGLPFESIHEGRMHACGHDIHMAVALGLLDYCVHTELKNDILFIFQPAEENVAGGKLMFDSGVVDAWLPDEIYALHVAPWLPAGTVSTKAGPLFAGDATLNIQFRGADGHGGHPHEANDMIIAVTAFIQQVQTILSRNVNPMDEAVITFGELHAGKAENIITGEAQLKGTARALKPAVHDMIEQRMREIGDGIANSFQCRVNVGFDRIGYEPVVNHPDLTEQFIRFVAEERKHPFILSEPNMTCEDFGYWLTKIPGTMFWLGVDSPYGLHNSRMAPDERSIQQAVDLLAAYFTKRDDSI